MNSARISYRWQVAAVKKDSETNQNRLPPERLSQVSTAWSAILLAHQSSSPQTAASVRRELLHRYLPAARRYLRSLCRNDEQAEDLIQEFSLRFLAGKMRRADPSRGSFRKYLKTTLINLVRENARRKKRGAQTLTEEPWIEEEITDKFDDQWCEHLLEQTWLDMARIEQETGKPLHSLLQYRVRNPQASSDELSVYLHEFPRTQNCSPQYARKWLQRAREQFARLLTRHVRDTLADPSAEELDRELRELGLQRYCNPGG